MKFQQNQQRQPRESRYADVKAPMSDAQWQLFTALLSQSDGLPGRTIAPAIRRDIRLADPDFVAGLAEYFAGRPGVRHLAFLLTAELATTNGNDEGTALLVAKVVRHATAIPEWLEYFAAAAKPGKKPCRAIRNQLTVLFNGLDEYQVTRCTRESLTALRETLHFLRPKTADRIRRSLFTRIGNDLLPVRSTWQQEWLALYRQSYDSPEQRQIALRDKWKEGISSFRIGYKVLLENLRPMLSAGVSGKVLKLAAEYLGNAAAVRHSGVSPTRLLEVYRSLRRINNDGVGRLTEALEKAMPHSSWARCEFGSNGISVIAIDVSQSMKRPLGDPAGIHYFDIAPLLALLWKSRGNGLITGILGNTWRPFNLSDGAILPAVDVFRAHEGEAGYGINAWLILRDLLRKGQVVDRVLVFTDCRLWDKRSFHQPAGSDLGHWWRQYKRQLAPQAKLYLIDLAGYGATKLESMEDDVFLVSGWSENSCEILGILETACR